MRTLLLVSQVYVPDPTAVGQYLHDAAVEMVRRGWRVVVLTSARGYDDPAARYPARESVDGVEVVRLPLSSFGKRSIAVRLLGQVSFLLQAIVRGVFVRGLSAIFISTSPPMCAVAALAVAGVRRVPVHYWVMDVNPDQAVALGKFREDAWPVRLFNVLNRAILRRARSVVTLDTFMADKLRAKVRDEIDDIDEKLRVLPLWPQDEHLEDVPHAENPFRKRHGLAGKVVFAYSGNHSPFNPIHAFLDAALRFRDRDDVAFLFIGGGTDKALVDETLRERPAANVLSLPYQPLADLRYSLSAADVHLVAVGDSTPGCCHPSKAYAALSVGRPMLLAGPEACHVGEMIRDGGVGWRVDLHDADGVAERVQRILDDGPAALVAVGERARRFGEEHFDEARLRAALAEVLEYGP